MTASGSGREQDGNRSNRIVYTIAFTNFALPFMFSGVGVTLPSMSRDLAMGGATLGLFETLYLGIAAALILPAGRLGDAGDKASFFCWGIAGFTLSTLCLGLAPNVPLALAARVAQGVSVSLVGATNMAILAETVPHQRLGRAMGRGGCPVAMRPRPVARSATGLAGRGMIMCWKRRP